VIAPCSFLFCVARPNTVAFPHENGSTFVQFNEVRRSDFDAHQSYESRQRSSSTRQLTPFASLCVETCTPTAWRTSGVS